ncbi:MAG: TonB-dependent receptor [Deltaproteobacteria bacterium]|nr:TonB-dependent receptor [Deltaproteobacteria bacterium]
MRYFRLIASNYVVWKVLVVWLLVAFAGVLIGALVPLSIRAQASDQDAKPASGAQDQSQGSIPVRAEKPDSELEELLDMGLKELSEIEITSASKHTESLVNAPATVRVITEEQIRERGYLTLEQALADLPGMQFRNPLSLNSYVFLRGVPNQNNLVLVLVDGVEINELNSGGFYAGGQYNLANVKRIEVVYGPTSALYGTNAVSGVINIVTKDPEDAPPGLQVGGSVGGFDTGLGDLQYAYYDPQSRFGLRVSGMLKTTEHADLTGRRNDYMWTPDLELFEDDRALDVKLRYCDFLFGLNYQNRVSSAATYNRSMGTIYHDHDTYWNLRFVNAYLQHRVALTKEVSLQSKVYSREATVLDDSVREITEEGQFGFFRPNYRIGAETLIDARPLRDLNLVGGLVFEYDWLAEAYATSESESPEERPPRPSWPDLTENYLLSGYLQAQYMLIKLVQLTAGLRFDHSSVYDNVVVPRTGIVFTWEGLFAKLLYGEAFRAAKPWDYTDGLGNPGLDPERMRSVELSLGYLFKELLRLETSVYFNRLYDVLGQETLAGAEEQWRWVNAGHIDTLGLEIGPEVRVGPFRSFANYTYTRSRDQDGAPVPEIAEQGANLGVGYRFTDRIHSTVWGQYLGLRRNPKVIAATGDDRIDPAFVLNASLSFLDLRGFDFQVIVRNLLDQAYYHPSNRPPDRYRQPQRTVLVKAAYRF